MDYKRTQRVAELKVGIFVMVAAAILALAIFNIGRRVGLFEPVFRAKTYLSSVSGLKESDVVRLAGVEVGNITRVDVTPAGDPLPETATNHRNLQLIEELSEKTRALQEEITSHRSTLAGLESDYETAVERSGARSREVRELERRQKNLRTILDRRLHRLQKTEQDITKAQGDLQNIVVYMEIRENRRDWIRADSNISMGSRGLLGDRYIDVSLGRSEVPSLEDKDGFVVIAGTQQAGFQELITGADDVLANFGVLSLKLQDVMDRFEKGEGTVGKFFSDASFYNNLNETVAGAKVSVDHAVRMMQDITRGSGTIPQLIQQRDVYDKLNNSLGRLEHVMTQIDQGTGTLGKFVNDPSLYRKSEQVMENIDAITQRMDTGQGTLGKLSTDTQLYEEAARSIQGLAQLVENIEQGNGTLGQLAQNDRLYKNLNEVTAEVIKLIYDFRQNPKKFLTVKFELF